MKKVELIIGGNTMTIFEKSNIYIFDFNDIIGIFCEHPYVSIETVHKKSKLIFHSLKEIEELLPFPFIACNQSSIINIKHIIQVINENSKSFLLLKNGKKICVPRRKKNDIMEKIRNSIKESFTI